MDDYSWTVYDGGLVTTVHVAGEDGVQNPISSFSIACLPGAKLEPDRLVLLKEEHVVVFDTKSQRLRKHWLPTTTAARFQPLRCVCLGLRGRCLVSDAGKVCQIDLRDEDEVRDRTSLCVDLAHVGSKISGFDYLQSGILDMVATPDNRLYCVDNGQQLVFCLDLISGTISILARRSPPDTSGSEMDTSGSEPIAPTDLSRSETIVHPDLRGMCAIALDPLDETVLYVSTSGTSVERLYKFITPGIKADLVLALRALDCFPSVLCTLLAEYAVRPCSVEPVHLEKRLTALAITGTPCGLLLIACCATDSIWATDPKTGRIMAVAGELGEPGKYTPRGLLVDGLPRAARFSRPSALALAPSEQALYVTDAASLRIRRVPLHPRFFIVR